MIGFKLDTYMNLNFVKEVQLIVDHFILTVFATVVKTTQLNREDINVQQYEIPKHILPKVSLHSVTQKKHVMKSDRITNMKIS